MGPHQVPAALTGCPRGPLRTRMGASQLTQAVSLRAVLDALPLSIFWKDESSRYVGCNEFFARAAGLPEPQAVTGLSDRDMPWADNAERFREEDLRVLRNGGAVACLRRGDRHPGRDARLHAHRQGCSA